MPSVSIDPLKPLLILSRAPTTSSFFSDQSLLTSLCNFWYFSIFSISFSHILQSPGIATSVMTHYLVFLSTKIKLGFLASMTLPNRIFISQIYLTSSSSTTPEGQCSCHFSFLSSLCFSHNFQWNNFCKCVMSSFILTLR